MGGGPPNKEQPLNAEGFFFFFFFSMIECLGIGPVVFVYMPEHTSAESANTEPGGGVPEPPSSHPVGGGGSEASGVGVPYSGGSVESGESGAVKNR